VKGESSVAAMFQEATELQVYETHLCRDAAGRGRGLFQPKVSFAAAARKGAAGVDSK
jgi:hypothetical protein